MIVLKKNVLLKNFIFTVFRCTKTDEKIEKEIEKGGFFNGTSVRNLFFLFFTDNGITENILYLISIPPFLLSV